MAACITTFVFRPNTDVEDPGDFLNSEEEIPCIATYGIQKNAVWDLRRSTQNNAIGHPEPNDVAGDIRLPNDIDLTDQVDEEEETNGVLLTDDSSPRRPPTPLREPDLAVIDDETREEIKTLEGEWDTHCEQVKISVVLRPGRGDDHPVGEIDEHFIQ
jgi:hypothetical protein